MEEQTLKLLGIIKKKKLFWKINKLFFEFLFCNLYQAYYSQIIDISLNELSPKMLIESVFEEKSEKEGKDLIQTLIDNSLNNMKFNFESNNNTAFHPNFSLEVSLLTKIFASTNEHVKNLIKDNKNLEVFNKVLGDEAKKIFEQKLLLSDNEVQFGTPEEQEEKKPEIFFGNRSFMDLMEQDMGIYKIYLEGGDYQKALDEKIENEKKEQEQIEKELEEKKKAEEEAFKEEEEQDDNKKFNLKGSLNMFDQEGEEENEKKDKEKEENAEENDNENEKEENKGEEKIENTNEESSTEENENLKEYNDVNFWKTEISPNDEIMSSVLNDLD